MKPKMNCISSPKETDVFVMQSVKPKLKTFRKSRLSWEKQKSLIGLFNRGDLISDVAELTNTNKNTVQLYFKKLRELLYFESENPGFITCSDHFDPDSFFGRINGARAIHGGPRSFGLKFIDDRVYVVAIPQYTMPLEKLITDTAVVPDAVVVTENFRTYNNIELENFLGERDGLTVEASIVRAMKRIDEISEYAKSFMTKYKGIRSDSFYLYLKEFEWRLNSADEQTRLTELYDLVISNGLAS